MLENEAAYKKVNEEREHVNRLLKTTFDPEAARKKAEAGKILEGLNKKYLSVDARTPYEEGSL
jgi:hypothetical protein